MFKLQYFADEVASAETVDTATAVGSDNGSVQEQPAAATEAMTFDQMLDSSEDYRKEFDSRVQKAVKGRVKNLKPFEDKYNALAPAMAVMKQYYGVESDEDVINKIQGDDHYFKQKAIENNTTPAAERNNFNIVQKNNTLQAQIDAINAERAKEMQFRKWDEEIPAIKNDYPDFDLARELDADDGTFTDVANRYGIRAAYEFVHRGELTQKAQRKGAEKVANTVRSNMARPVESGLGTNASPPVRQDPTKFTKADFDRIREETRAGRPVSF